MATHTELVEMWDLDSRWDVLDLIGENRKIDRLHHKYSKIRLAEKTKYEEMIIMRDALEGEKKEFYLKGTDEVWREKGWEEWPGGRVLKADLNIVIPQDKHLIETNIKIGAQKAKIEYLDDVINQIKNRRWTLKNINDTKRFNSGD